MGSDDPMGVPCLEKSQIPNFVTDLAKAKIPPVGVSSLLSVKKQAQGPDCQAVSTCVCTAILNEKKRYLENKIPGTALG